LVWCHQISLSKISETKDIDRFYDFVFEDFDEFFVFIGYFLLILNLCDDLIFLTDCRDYADLVTRVYKYMRIYLWTALSIKDFREILIR
jgi:hypothetical protein